MLEDDFEYNVCTDIEECNPVLFHYTSVEFVVGDWENRWNIDSNRTYIRPTYRSLELNIYANQLNMLYESNIL